MNNYNQRLILKLNESVWAVCGIQQAIEHANESNDEDADAQICNMSCALKIVVGYQLDLALEIENALKGTRGDRP